MNKYPVSLTAGTNKLESLVNTNLLLDQSFIGFASNLVAKATGRIWICAYTWRWYADAPEKDIQHFNQQIIKAVARGVEVRCIMHNKAQMSYLNKLGIEARRLRTKKTMHTKALLIDTEALILGSHNLTEKGTAENYEASLLTKELEPILQFETYFRGMWENFSGA